MEGTPPTPTPPTPGTPPAPAPPAAGAPQTGEQAAVPAHSADPHERIDGLRAWLAQLDRKLGVRTYALGAAAVLALAAGAVALVLALQLQEDSATKADLQALRDELGAVEKSAAQAAEEDVQSVTTRLDQLETDVAELRSGQQTSEDELSVVQDDIDDLRSQVNDLEASGSGGTSP